VPSRLLYILLLCVLVTSVPAPADILSFSDTTFDPAHYNFSNPPVISGGVTNYSYGQCAACGNPTDPLEAYGFRASITTDGPGGAFVGFLNNTFDYNPQTQGAINYIDTSVDKNLTVDSTGGDFTSNYYPILEQGKNFYMVEILGPALNSPNTSTGYSTIGQTGMTYDQFGLFDFATQTFDTNSHPDFSTNGAQITLGFAPLISANGPFTITADYDNLSFDINYSGTTQSPVPESSSLGLLSIFLMGVVLRGLGPAVRWKLKRH
jgi:hypothetical protein